MMMLPEKIRLLHVGLGGRHCGNLVHQSQVSFSYLSDGADQPSVGLLMPPSQLVYRASTLFPVMDQNLPEGYLFQALRAAFPKQPLGAMHLLALMGDSGIGRLGFHLPDAAPAAPARPMARDELLRTRLTAGVFEQLVQAPACRANMAHPYAPPPR